METRLVITKTFLVLLFTALFALAASMAFVGWSLLAVPAYYWLLVSHGMRPEAVSAYEILQATVVLGLGMLFSSGLVGFLFGRWVGTRKHKKQ